MKLRAAAEIGIVANHIKLSQESTEIEVGNFFKLSLSGSNVIVYVK